MVKLARQGFLLIFLTFAVMATGCIDRGSQIFKKWSEKESADSTEYTEKVISDSPQLQKLESVCRELPYFREQSPGRKSISRKHDALFYYYRLNADFKLVSEAVTDVLANQGWNKTKTENGLWENQIEFEKGSYWIQVSNGNFGEENYSTNCLDKEIAGN